MRSLSYDLDTPLPRVRPITLKEKLLILLLPDRMELLLLGLAYLLAYQLISPLFQIVEFWFQLVVWGWISLVLVGYRWGHGSNIDLMLREERIHQAHLRGDEFIINFKIFGAVFSSSLLFLGYAHI
ncbi:MAG: hypothetical protein ACXAD7_17515 [Candidatus Kariarchaeaceae archaeon]